MAIKKAKIFTLTSAGGGAGKSTTAINLAGLFSEYQLKVLIVDLKLSGGTIAASLNIEQKSDIFKITEDISTNNFKNIKDYVSVYSDYIHVISATKDPRYASRINPLNVQLAIDKYAYAYDIILIDTSSEFSVVNLVAFDLSDTIIYLLKNDILDFKNMKSILAILKDGEINNYFIVLNDAISQNKGFFSLNDVKNILKENVNFTIPASFHLKNMNQLILDGEIPVLNPRVRLANGKGVKHHETIVQALLTDTREKGKTSFSNQDLTKYKNKESNTDDQSESILKRATKKKTTKVIKTSRKGAK